MATFLSDMPDQLPLSSLMLPGEDNLQLNMSISLTRFSQVPMTRKCIRPSTYIVYPSRP